MIGTSKLATGDPATGKPRTSSSTVAIGTATLFLAVAGLASFLADDHIALGGGWTLRGALIPAAEAGAAVGRFERPRDR